MKTFAFCFIIFVFVIHNAYGSEIQARKSICDSNDMDRIARTVVQESQLHLSLDQKTSSKEDQSWRQRHPIAFGSLLGFGIGFGFVLVMATGGDTDVLLAGLFYGGIGAGIGALIGSFY